MDVSSVNLYSIRVSIKHFSPSSLETIALLRSSSEIISLLCSKLAICSADSGGIPRDNIKANYQIIRGAKNTRSSFLTSVVSSFLNKLPIIGKSPKIGVLDCESLELWVNTPPITTIV